MKQKAIWAFVCFTFCFFSTAMAQRANVKGKVVDKTDNSSMIGVGVLLVSQADTSLKAGTSTDIEGNFTFLNQPIGKYALKVVYIGYENLEIPLLLEAQGANLGVLKLTQAAVQLKDVVVEGRQVRSQQKGDTVEYNANAFKTNPDATAQDLVVKMPGVTLENGQVKAQGEAVKKVLIDGKEYFGDDAAIALKNLPADLIDKIQVFDKMSDQAQFSGFDDGNSQKAINIMTKNGMNNSTFGKVYGGYGTDSRYSSGFNFNNFKRDRRTSIIGLSNNINLQNFASQDLLGVLSSSTQNRGPGGGAGGGTPGGGGGGGGGNPASNFLVGSQGGITQTTSIGLNYSDKWGKKWTVTGSYFFNNANNTTQTLKDRNYFLSQGRSQMYNETSDGGNNNYNHRFAGRLEYKLDTSNTFILTPKVSLQTNSATINVLGVNTLADNKLLSQIQSNTNTSTQGYDISNDLLFRHKFQKKGRTFSTNVTTSMNNKVGNSDLYSQNRFYLPIDSSTLTNQQTATTSGGYTISSNLTYTEPVGKIGGVMFNYSPSYNKNNSDREAKAYNDTTNEYTTLNKVLSNKFDNSVLTQKTGIGYRASNKKFTFMVNANYQNVQLRGEELFPNSLVVQKTFDNVLPMAMFNYKFSPSKNLRMYYRTSTNAPSVTQLQNVINNANPLQLSTGNPDLKQEYTHVFVTRYGYSNPEKATSLQAFVNFTYTNNYIGSSTLIANQNTVLNDNVTLNRGSQLSKPINLNGYINTNSFFTYGMPVGFLKSNLNLSVGYLYSRTPSQINNAINLSNSNTFTSGFTLGSNISQKLDFTLSYSANYNVVQNSIRPTSNNNYFYHISSFKLNALPWKGLLLGTELTNTLYNGLGGGFNQDYYLLNPYLGYKFLKANAAEIKLTAFDLLDQNNSIARNITASYLEDTRTLVLKRYFMLIFTYNFKKIAGKA